MHQANAGDSSWLLHVKFLERREFAKGFQARVGDGHPEMQAGEPFQLAEHSYTLV